MTSKKPPQDAIEVEVAHLEKALDISQARGKKFEASRKALIAPQLQDAEMIIDEEDSDDDGYITEEVTIEDYSNSSRRGDTMFSEYRT